MRRRFVDHAFLALWSGLWTLGLPLVWLYLRRRARKEPLYARHFGERLGGGAADAGGAIWVHAVSLGELRAAQSLIRVLMGRGERVVLSTITAAGRTEAGKLFAAEIAGGQMRVVWAPIDAGWAVSRFLRRHRPRFGVVLEIELWPQMIAGANRAGVPLVMAQAQYPEKSFARDRKGLRVRAHLVRGFGLILAKSERHAARFRELGAKNVLVTGELRFEQPVPQAHLDAADAIRARLGGRPVFCCASTHPDEDPLLIPVLHRLKARFGDVFFVYVPRHPHSFDESYQRLVESGLAMARRSTDLDSALSGEVDWAARDGLFGDSLGEINFYFRLSDRVFMGDSLVDEGSHNVIEPLVLERPVAVGPSIWGIEYPGREALEARVLTQVGSAEALADLWCETGARADGATQAAITAFLADHGGATERILAALEAEGLI